MKKPQNWKQPGPNAQRPMALPNTETRRRELETGLLTLRRAGQFDTALHRINAFAAQNPTEVPYANFMRKASDPVWWSTPTGRRARLRRRGATDLTFIRGIWRPDFLRLFNPLSAALPTDDAALTRVLSNEYSSLWMQTGYLHWTIETHDGQPFGIVSLTNVAPSHGRVELLVGVSNPPYQAAAIEATLLAIDFVFGPMRMHKICALIAPDNHPSLESAKHLGFSVEGVLRHHIFNPMTARFADLTHCALLHDDPMVASAQARVRKRLLGK